MSTPTLTEIDQSAATAIETRLDGADTTPPRNLLFVLRKTLSGAVDGLYGRIDRVESNIIFDTCSTEFLIRYAKRWGIPRNKPTGASGDVTFTGTSGKTVDAGTLLSRSDGVQYKLSAAVTLSSGTATGTVTCISAGSVTNTDAGGKLTLTSTVDGVATTVTVGSEGLTGGDDIETLSHLLERLEERIQETPQGGSDADYRRWALSVSGVTRVWVYRWWLGVGTVGITFMMDDRDDPIPTASDVAAVQDIIDANCPVDCTAFVFAPTANPLNPMIHLNPDSTAIRTAVQAQLASLIANKCTPGGTYVLNGVSKSGGLLYLSQVRAAVSAAAGEVDYTMASPAADRQESSGYITTLGIIAWA